MRSLDELLIPNNWGGCYIYISRNIILTSVGYFYCPTKSVTGSDATSTGDHRFAELTNSVVGFVLMSRNVTHYLRLSCKKLQSAMSIL